ncbi:MAG TPA: MFS transporter [Dehalococcoidia bacterium]|nr:MFS transporter [Dehalococcoidia bacterium]
METTPATTSAKPEPPIFTRDFALVCLATLLFFTAFLFYFPTLPTFAERLGSAESEIGLLIAASSMTALVVRPFVGQLIDALGSRRLVVAGALLYVFTTLAYNLADSMPLLIVVRIFNGMSLATFVTSTGAYVADIAPVARRGEAMGYYGLANNLAFAIGPLIAVGVMDASALADAEEAINARAGWLAGAAAKPENFTLVFLLASGFALAAFVMSLRLRETGAARYPFRFVVNPADVFTRSALFPSAINFVSSFAFATIVTFVALFAKDNDMGGGASLFFLIYAASIMAMRLIGGRLSDRYGRGSMIVPGIAILAASLLVTGYAQHETMFWFGAMLYGVGAGAAQPALMALTVDLAAPEERGRAMGTFTLSNDLGLSLGALALGVILEASNYETMYTVAAVIVLAGALIYVLGSGRLSKTATVDASSGASP